MNLETSRTVVFDIESFPNYTLFAFLLGRDNTLRHFELRGADATLDTDSKTRILRIMGDFTSVGFNSLSFDLPLLLYGLKGASAGQLQEMCNGIISTGAKAWMTMREYGLTIPRGWDHIDLKEPSPGVMTSLKVYGGRLHSRRLQDLPYEPGSTLTPSQMDLVREYCINDLTTTQELFEANRKALELRNEMSERYQLDLMSKSDAQIAEAVLVKQLGFTSKVKVPSYGKDATFRYNVPQYLRDYQTSPLRQVVEFIANHKFGLDAGGSIQLPKELKDLKIEIGNSVYQMGIGGLHSQEVKRTIVPSSTQHLLDKDVTSYYPSIILTQGLFPTQLGPRFLSVYRSIVERRIAAKKAGNKSEADSLKICVNGSFGKLGSKYSALYSPQLLMQVTLTGQLALLRLIVELEASGIRVVSANTDGFVSLIDDFKLGDYEMICKEWETLTGFNLEATTYRALFSRDVNNYVGITPANKEKAIGVFRTDSRLMNNPTFQIVAIAAKNFLVNGTPVEQTIRGCTDIRQFLSVRTVKGGAIFDSCTDEDSIYTVGDKAYKTVASADRNSVKLGTPSIMSYTGGRAQWERRKNEETGKFENHYVGGGQYLGRAVRWYWSTTPGSIHYRSNGNRVPETTSSQPMMTLSDSIPADLDYERYIREANLMIESVGYFEATVPCLHCGDPVKVAAENRTLCESCWEMY